MFIWRGKLPWDYLPPRTRQRSFIHLTEGDPDHRCGDWSDNDASEETSTAADFG